MSSAVGGNDEHGLISAFQHQECRIEPVYQNLTEILRTEIIEFWVNTGALFEERARQRVDQVAFVVRNGDDDLVGISTVNPARHGPDNQLYLEYRMFIHPAHRTIGMMRSVTRATRCFFDANPDVRGSARGMLICTENPKLMRPGIKRMFERSMWVYAGKDPRGFDLWRFIFTS
jgi:hypothetical protein